MKVLWSRDAGDDLMEIITCIAGRSGKPAAREIYSRIRGRVQSANEFPSTGRVVPELAAIGIADIRELIDGTLH